MLWNSMHVCDTVADQFIQSDELQSTRLLIVNSYIIMNWNAKAIQKPRPNFFLLLECGLLSE